MRLRAVLVLCVTVLATSWGAGVGPGPVLSPALPAAAVDPTAAGPQGSEPAARAAVPRARCGGKRLTKADGTFDHEKALLHSVKTHK